MFVEKKVGTVKYISQIKNDSRIIYNAYLNEQERTLYKVLKKDTIYKRKALVLNPYCVILFDTTGRLAAYTYHLEKGQFYKVDKERILKFRALNDTTMKVDIDPFSNENQGVAYKDKTMHLFVILNFLNKEGKVVLPKDR